MDDGPETPRDVARDQEAEAELTAAMARALPAEEEQLPGQLAAALVARGEAVVKAQEATRSAARGAVPADATRTASRDPSRAGASSSTPPSPRDITDLARYRTWAGWMVAAAAMIALLVMPRADARTPFAPSIAQLRADVLARDSAAVRLAWSATTDPAANGAAGDVTWSDATQRGVMRLAGLEANDRTRWQYQLWIFDRDRDEKYPVDGGVFDVPPGGGDVLVPISARVKVGSATLFAVTVERAGGVVVSSRERIVLLAQRKG